MVGGASWGGRLSGGLVGSSVARPPPSVGWPACRRRLSSLPAGRVSPQPAEMETYGTWPSRGAAGVRPPAAPLTRPLHCLQQAVGGDNLFADPFTLRQGEGGSRRLNPRPLSKGVGWWLAPLSPSARERRTKPQNPVKQIVFVKLKFLIIQFQKCTVYIPTLISQGSTFDHSLGQLPPQPCT